MSPLLGIWASGQQAGQIIGTSFEPIATSGVSGGGVTFSSIPQTYTHLQLRVLVKTTRAAEDNFLIQLNGDNTAGNYYDHYVQGNGTSATAGTLINSRTDMIIPGYTPSSTATSTFAASIIDILDYTNTNKYKTVRALTGYDANGSGMVGLYSGLWKNTNAVTSVYFAGFNASLDTATTVALYGIKAA